MISILEFLQKTPLLNIKISLTNFQDKDKSFDLVVGDGKKMQIFEKKIA
jgi:hypothetical protein